jgi:hypothetical protein
VAEKSAKITLNPKKGDRLSITLQGGHQIEITVCGRINQTKRRPLGGIRLTGDQFCLRENSQNGNGPAWSFHNKVGNKTSSFKIIHLMQINSPGITPIN